MVVAPQFDAGDRVGIDRFVDGIVDGLRAADPQLVFVCVGFPKDQLIIAAMLDRWSPESRPVFLAVGASFEMLFGLKTRAPRWMQRYGLEWLFRFAQEPRRLFVRYFVRDPAFIALVFREWRGARVNRKTGDKDQ